MFAPGMRGWLVGLAFIVVAAASVAGLWVTWDATQTSSAMPGGAPGAPQATSPMVGRTTTTTVATSSAPPCEVGDEPVDGDPLTEWDRIVVDTRHRLPPEFAPDDLVDVTAAGFETRDQVRQLVVDDLAAFRAAAEANGTPIVVVSGYRSHSYQQQLFDEAVAETGEEVAALRTARAGHSEHQLGTAIDVLDPSGGDLTPEFGATPTGQWVAAHAHEFGFVLSYPEGAVERACYEYEPWHLRYVGRDTAAEIHASGVTAREWMLAARAVVPADGG